MIIEATVTYDNTYDKIKCSGEQYIVAVPREMIAGEGEEWRVFKYCPSKDAAEAVLRAEKAKFPDAEFKIVLIKWECNEVKS